MIDALVDGVALNHNRLERVHLGTTARAVIDQLKAQASVAFGNPITDGAVAEKMLEAGDEAVGALGGDAGVRGKIDIAHVEIDASLPGERQHRLHHWLGRDVEGARLADGFLLTVGLSRCHRLRLVPRPRMASRASPLPSSAWPAWPSSIFSSLSSLVPADANAHHYH
ncbi:hypothetical protein WJ972_21560 [Achromobacter insuavis]